MPSAPRDRAPGLHHVWVNATGNWPYFYDDVDRVTWVRLLVRTLDRSGWTCIAFCQMTTHVHAIVGVPDLSLPEGMRYLNREYSRDFNARHGRVGHFVRQRYGSRRIQDARDLVGGFGYVVLNPVRAGMCPRAEDWRWSSFATTIGLTDDFAFVDASLVLAEFGGSATALREYAAGQAACLTFPAVAGN
jgi:REP-associated tyrosine transposase